MSAVEGWVLANMSDDMALITTDSGFLGVAPGMSIGALLGKEGCNMADRHQWHIVGLQSQDDELQAAGAKVIIQEFRHIGQSPGQGCRPWLFMASLERKSGGNKLLTKIKSCWSKSTVGGDGGCC